MWTCAAVVVGLAVMSEKTSIQILQNGPIIVSGDFELTGAPGAKVESGEKVALCRCGASQTKPFCDGAHKKIGFADGSGE